MYLYIPISIPPLPPQPICVSAKSFCLANSYLSIQPNYISKFCEVETDKHSYIHSYSILMKPKKFLKRKQKMFSPGVRCLKGTASRDFYPLISGLTKPSEPLIGMLNNFRIRIRTERLNFLNNKT